MNRRSFLKLVGAAALNSPESQDTATAADSGPGERIDRHALVTRHNVTLNRADALSPLSVGNGEFAFTADVTGLQTFEADYNNGIPLSTMAQWGFHTAPNPQQFSLAKFPLTYLETQGRQAGYLY